MTKRDVLSVAFKIIGVFCLFTAVLAIPMIGFGISMATQHGDAWTLISNIVYPIWLIGFAYIFFQFAEVFAEKLFPEDAELPKIDFIQLEKSIFILAVRIIGVVSLARGIPELFKFILILPKWKYEAIPHYAWENVVGGIALLAFGTYLLSGGKKLAEFAYPEKPELQSEELEDKED